MIRNKDRDAYVRTRYETGDGDEISRGSYVLGVAVGTVILLLGVFFMGEGTLLNLKTPVEQSDTDRSLAWLVAGMCLIALATLVIYYFLTRKCEDPEEVEDWEILQPLSPAPGHMATVSAQASATHHLAEHDGELPLKPSNPSAALLLKSSGNDAKKPPSELSLKNPLKFSVGRPVKTFEDVQIPKDKKAKR